MSEQERTHESHSTIPPHPREHKSGMGMSLPALLTIGGGLAALWLLENQTQAISRTAERAKESATEWWHEAEGVAGDWLEDAGERSRGWAHQARERVSSFSGRSAEDLISAGAKALGIAGLLKSVGASRTAKFMAFKKLADYATSALGQSRSETIGRARSAGREGAHRMREAYHALRGDSARRRSDEKDWDMSDIALLGTLLVGAGVASAYLLNPSSGGEHRRTLRLRTRAASRQATQWAHEMAGQAREWVGSAAEGVGMLHGGSEAMNDEQLASRVRQEIATSVEESISDLRVSASEGRVTLTGDVRNEQREAVLKAARRVPGVRDVEIQSGNG